MSTTQLREWALCLADLGWKVFPLRPGTKRGQVLHGLKSCPRTGICVRGHRKPEDRATGDPEQIRRCWSHGAYNIAVATGPSGLLVVDCDQPGYGHQMPDGWNTLGIRTGTEVLASLTRRAGATWPDTYTVSTPSGGTHYYFRAPAGLRNTAGKLGPLVDTRAAGGYVVGPGSITPEGGYELLDDTPPADLPGWLAQALAPKPPVAKSAPHEIAAVNISSYVSAALKSEAARLAAAPSGQQNRTLYEAAIALGRLVAGGAVDDTTVRTALHHTMARLPLSRPNEPWSAKQIDDTINSAFRYAAYHPRRIRGGEAA